MNDYISRDDGKIAAWQILEGMGYSMKHNDRLAEEVEAVFDAIPADDIKEVVLSYDYARLIKALRSDRWNALPPDLRNPVKQAADAIEELYAFREQITDGKFYYMKDGFLHVLTVALPEGKSVQIPFIEPPKEET